MDVQEKITSLAEERSALIVEVRRSTTDRAWEAVIHFVGRIKEIEAQLELAANFAEAQATTLALLKVLTTPNTAEPVVKKFCDDCSCGKAEGCSG